MLRTLHLGLDDVQVNLLVALVASPLFLACASNTGSVAGGADSSGGSSGSGGTSGSSSGGSSGSGGTSGSGSGGSSSGGSSGSSGSSGSGSGSGGNSGSSGSSGSGGGGPSCSDNKKNGTETDIDCGGSCPQKCFIGQKCSGNSDCASNRCQSQTCKAVTTAESWVALPATSKVKQRYSHTAVWTGNKMLVWGGQIARSQGASNHFGRTNTGGIYDPQSNSWKAMATANAPDRRTHHTAVWTGSEMIIWGGSVGTSNGSNTGGIYNPTTNKWRATATAGAPSARRFHTAVWTGQKMIVFGGGTNGGIFDPNTGSRGKWTAITTPSITLSTAVWTGQKAIAWGGFYAGYIYNMAAGQWTTVPAGTSSGAPKKRRSHAAVWTGQKMIVWGGLIDGISRTTNTGGIYDPNAGTNGTWAAVSTTHAPRPRYSNNAMVWTGTKVIVWGGDVKTASPLPDSVKNTGPFNTGGVYNPSTNTWTSTTTTGAPTYRGGHTVIWTGSKMIVWGGHQPAFNVTPPASSNGIYTPKSP